jgi:hypothetical protein
MKPLRVCAGLPLTWTIIPNATQPAYELLATNEPCAALRWGANSPSFALGETADGWWSFDRAGRLARRITIRLGASDTEVATFPYAWDGVTEVAPSAGHLYHFFQTGAPRLDWLWTDDRHLELLRISPDGRVLIAPTAATSPDLSLLTVLGWYFVRLKARDER